MKKELKLLVDEAREEPFFVAVMLLLGIGLAASAMASIIFQ